MADEMSRAVEREIADLAERLTAPGNDECLRCFLLRMITEFGCDGTYRWTIRWRDVCAAQPCRTAGPAWPARRMLRLRGPDERLPRLPPVSVALPCAGVARPGSSRPCDLRRLPKSA